MLKQSTKTLIFLLLATFNFSFDSADRLSADEKNGWNIIDAIGEPQKREDCGFVEVDGLFYLLGGRGILTVDVFNPATNTWVNKSPTPFEMHHFQAVTYNKEIYVVGGMTGNFPHETPLANIFIYNTKSDTWRQGASIPDSRRRGSAGTAIYKNKIYLIGGIKDGHYDGTVSWMDSYDLLTKKWDSLPDAPHARDHYHATLVNDKIYLAGGRRTSFKTQQVVDLTVPEIDEYDIKNKGWQTLTDRANLPTLRAGCTTVTYKNRLVVLGGESSKQEKSHKEVEALNPKTNIWLSLPALVTGRHDTQALVYKNRLYVVAGSANRGGGPDQQSIEVLKINNYLD